MINHYWEVQDSDRRYYRRFLENRLPDRIIDSAVSLIPHEDTEGAGVESKAFDSGEQLTKYISDIFSDIKYEYIVLPVPGEAINISRNNDYIAGIRTRSIISLQSDWTIESLENIISTAGLCGFNVSFEDIISQSISDDHLALLDKYEKVLRISSFEKQLHRKDNFSKLKDLHRQYSDIKIVIAGFGACANAEDFKALAESLGSELNTFYFDTHSVLDSGIFEAALDQVDSGKIIFSSGMPYSYAENEIPDTYLKNRASCVFFIYQQMKGLLDAIGNDDEVKRKVFIDNAESVYTLTHGQSITGSARVILKDVAQASGYSLRTVKKVMGGKEHVSDKVRVKVLSVAKELGYRKNKIASALARNERHKIAVVYAETSKYFFPEIRTGFENCIKEYHDFGIDVEFFVDKESKSDLSERQVNLLKELNLRKDIKGIVIHPFNSDELTHEINELEKAGKAVVTFVTDAPDSNRMCYVGSGGRKAGRIAAQLMGNYIGRKGKVSILGTLSNHWQSENRKVGFFNKMNESYPEIELEEPNYHKLLTDEEYYSYISTMLRENDINGIYTTSANVYLIGQLLKEIGKKDISLIGFDLSEETQQLLKDGFVDVIIFQNPELEAYKSLKVICDYILDGVQPESGSILTDVSIVTSECL